MFPFDVKLFLWENVENYSGHLIVSPYLKIDCARFQRYQGDTGVRVI